jgi:hypothetical protein
LSGPNSGAKGEENGPNFKSSQEHGKGEKNFGKIRKRGKIGKRAHQGKSGTDVIKARSDGTEIGFQIKAV